MIRTICDSGINWNWYLCGDFDKENKTVHIFYYDRWHKYEYRGSKHPKHEKLSGLIRSMNIIETEKRIVEKIQLEEIQYTVTNSANIFSYKDMTHYVSE